MIPQNTSLPAIVHSVTGEADVKDMAGEVMYMTTSFAIECWDSGYRNAAVLSAAVKAAMKAATSYWWGADLVGETDSYDPETNEDNVTLNYLITHQGD